MSDDIDYLCRGIFSDVRFLKELKNLFLNFCRQIRFQGFSPPSFPTNFIEFDEKLLRMRSDL